MTSRSRPTQNPSDERELVSLFADQAWRLFEIHWKRSEIFERRASSLLGFVSAALALLLINLPSSIELAPLTTVVLLVATASFVGAALSACIAIRALTVRGPASDQLRGDWRDYDSGKRLPAAFLQSAYVDSLIRGEDGRGVIGSIENEADRRATWFQRSVWLVGVGVVLVGVAFGLELVGEVFA